MLQLKFWEKMLVLDFGSQLGNKHWDLAKHWDYDGRATRRDV
jgi:hypothetical protein